MSDTTPTVNLCVFLRDLGFKLGATHSEAQPKLWAAATEIERLERALCDGHCPDCGSYIAEGTPHQWKCSRGAVETPGPIKDQLIAVMVKPVDESRSVLTVFFNRGMSVDEMNAFHRGILAAVETTPVYRPLYLPKITDEMRELLMDEPVMTNTLQGPDWTQEAVEFVMILQRQLQRVEPSALCPHGMPLAENVCGPCSEGRPNRAPPPPTAALLHIAAALRRAGAALPAPEVKGTIESAMVTGLSVALCVVQEEIDRHKHSDECWEPDSGCDMGRNEKYVVRSEPPSVFFDHELCDAEDREDCHGYEYVSTERGTCPCECHAVTPPPTVPTEPSTHLDGHRIDCELCPTFVILPYTDATRRAVSVLPMTDWTAPPTLCPSCSKGITQTPPPTAPVICRHKYEEATCELCTLWGKRPAATPPPTAPICGGDGKMEFGDGAHVEDCPGCAACTAPLA